MKQIASNYSISGAAVTLTGVNVPLSQILLVSDATTGNVLYSIAGPSASNYVQGTNSVLTLAAAPGSSDKLTIYYDDGVASANAPSSVSVNNFPSSTEISNDVGNPIPVSAASLPLPTGAAQDGTDGTGITAPTGGSGIRGWLSGIYNRLTLGSKTAANSLPVAIATDQIVSLGAALASQSQPVALATDQLVPLGQATMANSQPVVIASNQSAVPTTVSNAPTFSIPSFTSKTYTTTGGLITKVTYYNGATQVASRNITYSGGVIATDTLSIP